MLCFYCFLLKNSLLNGVCLLCFRYTWTPSDDMEGLLFCSCSYFRAKVLLVAFKAQCYLIPYYLSDFLSITFPFHYCTLGLLDLSLFLEQLYSCFRNFAIAIICTWNTFSPDNYLAPLLPSNISSNSTFWVRTSLATQVKMAVLSFGTPDVLQVVL